MSTLPISDSDLFIYYSKQDALAISSAKSHIRQHSDTLLKQFEPPLENSEVQLSPLSIARIIIGRCYALSPYTNSVELRLHIPIKTISPRTDGSFTFQVKTKSHRQKNLLSITRKSRTQFNVSNPRQNDVNLVLQRQTEIIPWNFFSVDLPDDTTRTVNRMFHIDENKENPFSYDFEVVRDLAHYIPLHIGTPALEAQRHLRSELQQVVSRVAPGNYWDVAELDLSKIDRLRGSLFGVDERMNPFTVDTAPTASETQKKIHHVVIALGSNVGNRIENIENALNEIERRGMAVRRVSPLYETKAMYVLKQDPFLNGVCQVSGEKYSTSDAFVLQSSDSNCSRTNAPA